MSAANAGDLPAAKPARKRGAAAARAQAPIFAEGGPRPRSDGRRVLFDVQKDEHSIPCAISQHALRDMMREKGKRAGAADLMDCFAAAWPRIEAMALSALRARRSEPLGIFYIWPDEHGADAAAERRSPG